jgi:hypothetical protein
VVVEAHHALHGAGDQLVLGIHAGGLRLQLHLQAFVLEVAQGLGQLGGQIDDLVDAAHHDGDVSLSAAWAAGRPRTAPDGDGSADSRLRREERTGGTWRSP